MAYRVAIHRHFSRTAFLAESPAHPARGIEKTATLDTAKHDFADQNAVNDYVTARGGVAADWLVLDLSAAGVN